MADSGISTSAEARVTEIAFARERRQGGADEQRYLPEQGEARFLGSCHQLGVHPRHLSRFVRRAEQSPASMGAMSSRGSSVSAAPQARAAAGMPNTTLLASSCAKAEPPACRIARSPCDPSSPI